VGSLIKPLIDPLQPPPKRGRDENGLCDLPSTPRTQLIERDIDTPEGAKMSRNLSFSKGHFSDRLYMIRMRKHVNRLDLLY
jgi:hypothetical protein